MRPLVHVVLPPPFDSFCLTPLLPTDAEVLHDLFNHRDVSCGIGVRRGAPFTREMAHLQVRRAHIGGRGWPLNALRHTHALWTEPFPPLLGALCVQRDGFTALPVPECERLARAERSLRDTDATWNLAAALDPVLHRRGVGTAALRFVLEQWFLPVVQPQPGQLTAYVPLAAGPGPRRWLERLGFRLVACVGGDTGAVAGPADQVVCALWNAPGKGQGVFGGLDRWEGDRKDGPDDQDHGDGACASGPDATRVALPSGAGFSWRPLWVPPALPWPSQLVEPGASTATADTGGKREGDADGCWPDRPRKRQASGERR